MSTMTEKPCAYCGKALRKPQFAPFCSAGCKDRDLLQWMGEGYALPVSPGGDDEDDNPVLDKHGKDGLDGASRVED